MDSLGFPVYEIMSSTNGGNFTSSFTVRMYFLFCCLIVVVYLHYGMIIWLDLESSQKMFSLHSLKISFLYYFVTSIIL